jgi:hypothetical protein
MEILEMEPKGYLYAIIHKGCPIVKGKPGKPVEKSMYLFETEERRISRALKN